MEKIDLILQGPYEDFVDVLATHYQQLEFVDNVIISCWEDDKQVNSSLEVKIVRSTPPKDPGTGNRNLQIVSSLAGLNHSTSEYVVRIRSDQKYSLNSMRKMYSYFLENKERSLHFEDNFNKPFNSIVVGGIFSPFPFHPRDHIFWGNRLDLIDLFSLPLEVPSFVKKYGVERQYESYHYDKYVRTESYLGTHYCSNFNSRLKLFLKEPYNYLVDNSFYRDEAMKISDEITHKIFKTIPSSILELEWPRYGWTEYRFDSQRNIFGERWAEDFNYTT